MPGFKSIEEVKAYIHKTFQRGAVFNGRPYKTKESLIAALETQIAENPSRASKAFASYVSGLLQAYLGNHDARPVKSFNLPGPKIQVMNCNHTPSTEQLMRKSIASKKFTSEHRDWIVDLLEDAGAEVVSEFWKLDPEVEQRVLAEFKAKVIGQERAEAEKGKSYQRHTQELFAELLSSGSDLSALAIGAYSLGSNSPEISSALDSLVKWQEKNHQKVTRDFLIQLIQQTSTQVQRIMKLEPEDALGEICQLGLIKGSFSDQRWDLAIQLISETQASPIGRRSEMLTKALIKIRQFDASKVRASVLNIQRCPLCGQTPCARGSQCYNED